MNRGPTVAQSLPIVDRYAGNFLIKPSYYCGTGVRNVPPQDQSPRCRYDATVGVTAGYHHGPTPYQHYQHLQEWYGRTAYWHHHHQRATATDGGGGPLQTEKANFAAHKHGAPLIQAAKYNRAGCGGGGPGKKYAKKAAAEQSNNVKKNDGGSDESSGAASENSLPRIIKPRKRRKKERKPMPVVAVAVTAVTTTTTVQPLADLPSSPPSPAELLPLSSKQLSPALQPRDAQFFDTVQLSADIKAVSLEDVSTCQCACCDPVGNVWDVGRRCFSPSLTRPEPARRSWSEESSSSVLKAVDYVKPDMVAPVARVRTHSLEVSSEIVTSHNGHRDIEIKFFTMPIGDR